MAFEGLRDLLSSLDHGLLIDLLALIDRETDKVDDLIAENPNADWSGAMDRAEALYGLAFVACQQYLNCSYRFSGLERCEAVARGPMYSPSSSYAQVVDAAANYWKHHGEWDGLGKGERKARAVLDRLFPSRKDYPMANVLYVLLGKPAKCRVTDLVPWLEKWRNGLTTP